MRRSPHNLRYVDLSHPIKHEMTTYPGLPGPTISTRTSREESAQRLATGMSLHTGRIEMVANTSTYVDTPYHFHANGPDVAELPLKRYIAAERQHCDTGSHTIDSPRSSGSAKGRTDADGRTSPTRWSPRYVRADGGCPRVLSTMYSSADDSASFPVLYRALR